MSPPGRQRVLPAQSSKKTIVSENLLSFEVMKENGQKDYRSLQIVALC